MKVSRQQSETVKLSLFCSGNECTPLRLGENEDRPIAIILGVADTNAIGLQWGYLNAATIQITEGTLAPKGPADIGWSDSAGMVVRLHG